MECKCDRFTVLYVQNIRTRFVVARSEERTTRQSIRHQGDCFVVPPRNDKELRARLSVKTVNWEMKGPTKLMYFLSTCSVKPFEQKDIQSEYHLHN